MIYKKPLTLVNVVCVAAIVTVIGAILSPVFVSTKEAARETAMSTIRQASLGAMIYDQDNDQPVLLASYRAATPRPFEGDDDDYQLVFLHYDYMLSTDPAFPHTHKPNRDSIDLVVDSFRRHRIILVIDPHHTALPEHQVLLFGNPYGCVFDDAVTYGSLKDQYFHPHGNLPWHYVIFGHYGAGPTCSDHDTGEANIPGYDFQVTLGWQFFRPFEGQILQPCP
ncbi:MAG: hypothetical protein ACHQ50_07415, partial [Fimbriimonadales bacterium]